jgi:DNA-binding GntR family transcriptional regulator
MARKIRHDSLTEKTYRKTKALLLNGRFAPGERLAYGPLSRELGVSLTPLREAALRLESEGFLVTLPRQGTFVRRLTREDAREIYDIREMLEALGARLAGGAAGPEQIALMRATLGEHGAAIAAADLPACVRADFRFHQQVVAAGGSRRLVELLEAFHLQLSSIEETGPDYLREAPGYLEEHRAVLDAIERREPALAEQLIRAHISRGRVILMAREGD